MSGAIPVLPVYTVSLCRWTTSPSYNIIHAFQGSLNVLYSGCDFLVHCRFTVLEKIICFVYFIPQSLCFLCLFHILIAFLSICNISFLSHFYCPTNVLNDTKLKSLKSTLYKRFQRQNIKKLKITSTCFGSYVIHHQGVQSCA